MSVAVAAVLGALLAGIGCLAAGRLRTRSRHRRLADVLRERDELRQRVQVADALARAERQRAEQASAGMYELLSGLVAAEEATRGQLSAELHDTVAQVLLLARSTLADRTPDVARAAELVQDAEEQLRAVMARTRPPALRAGDLAAAVGGLRRDLQHRYGLVVDLDWPEQPHPLPLAVAVTAYRFFQEALLNVVKHSDGDHATAGLAVADGQLTATVRDEGPGFDPAAVRSVGGRHVGLGLLAERARLAGGALTVRSTPGEPTLLTLQLPLLPSVGRFSTPAAG